MTLNFSLALIACAGGLCSLLMWRVESLARAAWFRWGGLGTWLLLLTFMRFSMSSVQELHPFYVLFIAASNLFWAPFIALFVVNTLASMARSALSLDDIKVPPAYSQAEAAASRKDFEEALRLYRKAAEEYPDEPDPCRRIAELYLMMGRPDDAVRAFRETEERQPDPRDKLLTVFAIAETLADVKKDLPGAIEILERFLAGYPDVKGREYAEGRIRLLRSRPGNAAQNGGAA